MYSGSITAAVEGTACSISSAVSPQARLTQPIHQADSAGLCTTPLSMKHNRPISAAPIAWTSSPSTSTLSNSVVTRVRSSPALSKGIPQCAAGRIRRAADRRQVARGLASGRTELASATQAAKITAGQARKETLHDNNGMQLRKIEAPSPVAPHDPKRAPASAGTGPGTSASDD